MGMMPPDAMAGMNGDMMHHMPPDTMSAMSDAQMDMLPPDAVPQAAPMDDGGMGALGAALEPAAPLPVPDAASDALGAAMDQATDQGAGGGAPDMGAPPDAGVETPVDDAPDVPDGVAPPDEPIV